MAGHSFNDDVLCLRGVAISLTLIAHLTFMQPVPSTIYLWIVNNAAQFWGGVFLFFVISGYVITRAFSEQFEEATSPRRRDFLDQWRLFYIRRVFRIVPTAMLWISIIVALAMVANPHGSFGAPRSVLIQAIAAATFTYNIFIPWILGPALAVFWSLSLEEQFYLLFPALSRIPRARRVAILGMVIALFSFIHRPPNQLALITSFPVDTLCYGMLIAILERHGWLDKYDPTFLEDMRLRYLNQLLSVLMLVIVPVFFVQFTQGTSILVAVCAWIVFCASFDKKYMTPPPVLYAVLRAFGNVSYSLYCCHMACYLLARELVLTLAVAGWKQNALAAMVAWSLCAIASLVSWRSVERPTREYGRKYILAEHAPAPA